MGRRVLLPDVNASVGLLLTTFVCPDCKIIKEIGLPEIPGVPLSALNGRVNPGSCLYGEATGLLHV